MPKEWLLNDVDVFASLAGDDESVGSTDLDMFIKIQEQVSVAENEFDKDEKLALSVFQAENNKLLIDLEDKAGSANLSKMLMQNDLRCAQAKTAFATLVDQAISDSQQTVDMSTKVFGMNDWAQFPLVKEEVDKIKSGKQAATKLGEEFNTQIEGIVAQVRLAEKPSVCKQLMKELGEAKSDATSSLNKVRKVYLGVKSMLKKQEGSKVKDVKAKADAQPAEFDIDVAGLIHNHMLCQGQSDSINVTDSFAPFTENTAACVMGDAAWAVALSDLATYKGLVAYLRKRKGDKNSNVLCTLEASTYLKPVQEVLATCTAIEIATLMSSLCSVTHEAWLKKLFAANLVLADVSYSTTGFGQHGLSQCVLVIGGTMLIF